LNVDKDDTQIRTPARDGLRCVCRSLLKIWLQMLSRNYISGVANLFATKKPSKTTPLVSGQIPVLMLVFPFCLFSKTFPAVRLQQNVA